MRRHGGTETKREPDVLGGGGVEAPHWWMETDCPATVTLPDRKAPKFGSTLKDILLLPEPEDAPLKVTQESPFVEDDQLHPEAVVILTATKPPLELTMDVLGETA